MFVPPKSGKGRTIRLPLRTVEALKAHRARQAEEKLKAGSLYQDDGLVFATEVGTPLEPSNIDRRSFKPLLQKAGLTDMRFHDLRHTCATVLLTEGVNPKVVQELLGHADRAHAEYLLAFSAEYGRSDRESDGECSGVTIRDSSARSLHQALSVLVST